MLRILVQVQFGRYQENILQEWSMVKNLSCVSCAAWNVSPINSLMPLCVLYCVLLTKLSTQNLPRWGGADLKLGQRNCILPPRTKMSYKRRCIQIRRLWNSSQFCNKGLLVVRSFCLWAVYLWTTLEGVFFMFLSARIPWWEGHNEMDVWPKLKEKNQQHSLNSVVHLH